MNSETPAKNNETPATPTPQRSRRKRWLAIAIGAFAVIGIAYGAYWALALRYEQSTDDAYVSGNVVQITPQISGIVVSIGADDTQFVKAGQTLVKLDQSDASVALEQAGAAGEDRARSSQSICDHRAAASHCRDARDRCHEGR